MGRTRRYDRDDLVEAGLELVHQSGFGAISMRSIAAAIGISPMALYRVIPDAEELKAVIADAPAATLQPARGPLEEVLPGWATQAYTVLSGYPGLAAFVLLRWTELPGWLGIVDALLGLAASEGVEGPLAVARVNAVFAYVLSRAQLRQSVAGSSRRLQLLEARPHSFRYVRANRDQFMVAQSDRHFLFGLTALLAGLGAIDAGVPGAVS